MVRCEKDTDANQSQLKSLRECDQKASQQKSELSYALCYVSYIVTRTTIRELSLTVLLHKARLHVNTELLFDVKYDDVIVSYIFNLHSDIVYIKMQL